MAVRQIRGTVTDTTGTVIAGATVSCTLAVGSAITATGEVVPSQLNTTTDVNGLYTFNVYANADLTPAGTSYVIAVRSGVVVTYSIVVPSTAYPAGHPTYFDVVADGLIVSAPASPGTYVQGPAGVVQAITAASAKILVAGTAANPTVDVGTGIPESAVTNLVADLAARGSKPTSTAAVVFVAAGGSDANDGLSWGTAKATVSAGLGALPAAGGLVEAGAGAFAGGFTVGANQSIRGRGPNATQFTGTGITIVTINCASTGNGMLSDCTVLDATGNAATIGINLDNAGAANLNWRIQRVNVLGNAALGDPNYLGIGIRCNFALKGVLDEVVVQYWNEGVHVQNASNANEFRGCKIRQNQTGLNIITSGLTVTDCFLLGCTIEGNRTGISSTAGLLVAAACHFENVIGATSYTDVSIGTGGRFVGHGNGYYSTVNNLTVASAASHSSFGEIFNGPVTNTGTGTLNIHEPVALPTSYAGTGPTILYQAGGIQGQTGTASRNVAAFSGFNNIVFSNDISATTGRLLRIMATANQRIAITDENANDKITASSAGIGLYGHAQVAQAGAIATPNAQTAIYVQADVTSLKTAIDAIRVALQNIGLTA